MSNPSVFLDSSALIAGVLSSQGAARALLLLSEDQKITLVVSEQVIVEVERTLARKMPKSLPFARQMIHSAHILIVQDPGREEVIKHHNWISHPADLPILLAASKAQVDFLATLNSKHFIDDPEVASKSQLKIGTPGDVLGWIRQHLASLK